MITSEQVEALRLRIEKAWHDHDEEGNVTISMADAMLLVEDVLVRGNDEC